MGVLESKAKGDFRLVAFLFPHFSFLVPHSIHPFERNFISCDRSFLPITLLNSYQHCHSLGYLLVSFSYINRLSVVVRFHCSPYSSYIHILLTLPTYTLILNFTRTYLHTCIQAYKHTYFVHIPLLLFTDSKTPVSASPRIPKVPRILTQQLTSLNHASHPVPPSPCSFATTSGCRAEQCVRNSTGVLGHSGSANNAEVEGGYSRHGIVIFAYWG